MEPWFWLYIVIVFGIVIWAYAIGSINAYNPHVPIQDEWRIYKKKTNTKEEE